MRVQSVRYFTQAKLDGKISALGFLPKKVNFPIENRSGLMPFYFSLSV